MATAITSQQNSPDLISTIDNAVLSVRTATLDFSFNELSSMYEEGELIIQPLYQRLFRWSESLQSQFIESLILELPIPPIFLVEREDRKYELIDGLQRMSSWLHFKGITNFLNTQEEGRNEPLLLRDCDIVQGLNGKKYEDLPMSLQIKLKRSYVRAQVIRKESSERLKYDMFKRLNTNGLLLSTQEIRNCTLRLLPKGEVFLDFINGLTENRDFKKCLTPVQDYNLNQQFGNELVLRFFSLKNFRENLKNYNGDLSDFMTGYAEMVADGRLSFDYEKEKKCFTDTFTILGNSMGAYSFQQKQENGGYMGQFLAFQYEAYTLGIQKFLLLSLVPDYKKLKLALDGLKNTPEFVRATQNDGKSGNRYIKKLNERISIVEGALKSL